MGTDADATAIVCESGADLSCYATTLFVGASAVVGNDNTAQFGDFVAGSCGGAGSGDYGALLTFGSGGTYSFVNESDFPSVMYALDPSPSISPCLGPEIACVDVPGQSGESFSLALDPGAQLVLIIDGENGECGRARVVVVSAQ